MKEVQTGFVWPWNQNSLLAKNEYTFQLPPYCNTCCQGISKEFWSKDDAMGVCLLHEDIFQMDE